MSNAAQTPIPYLLLHPIYFKLHTSQRLSATKPPFFYISSPSPLTKPTKSMDSPPPYTTANRSNPSSQTKSASRLARTTGQEPPPILSLDLVSYSPNNTNSPKPQNPISLHDLLLLSPSPAKRSKTRLDVAGEEVSDQHGSRRRCKNRFANVGSPRTTRRSRRRMEQEIREDKDKDLICGDDLVLANNKVKKRRHSGRSKKEKSVSCPSIPSPKGNEDDYGYNFDQIGLMVNDLIMWNDVAKSSLWFGLGSLCFLSSCFTTGISFSMLSLISQLGLICLGVSFFSNTIAQRNGIESKKRELKLKEDDILRAARVVLPAANFAISKARDLFSGEPSMTLKVAPLLLLGSEYGHIVTFKRLFALGFFIGFTGPKLYSLYSIQIRKKGEHVKLRTLEAWGGCSHKKIVAASAITAFWNLTSLKTRIFAAFICLVMFRWYRQRMPLKVEGEELEESQQNQEKALTLVDSMKVD